MAIKHIRITQINIYVPNKVVRTVRRISSTAPKGAI